MNVFFLNFKLEDTLVNFIKSLAGPAFNDVPVDVLTYAQRCKAGEELNEPWIAVRCMNSLPGFPEVQLDLPDQTVTTRMYTADIAIRTHAEDLYDTDGKTVLKDARTAHGELVGQVLSPFYSDTVKDDLNNSAAAVGNIAICQIDQPAIDSGVTDRALVTSVKFQILCNPTL